jgi:uncharacterized Zn finger protein (UPF0148 family)
MLSESQWEPAGECECGAPRYEKDGKTWCPDCSCDQDHIEFNFEYMLRGAGF